MTRWELLATIGPWEYWTDGGPDVYRRRVSEWNVTGTRGEPNGARWECTRAHYNRVHAPQDAAEYHAEGLDERGIYGGRAYP